MRTLLSTILISLLVAGGIYLYKNKKQMTHKAKPTEKIKIVTTFSILEDVIRNIGRDYIEVQAIVGPNTDAHIYRPTPKTAKMVAQADLVIVNGLGFEGWLDRLIEASGYKGPVIVASDGIVPKTLVEEDGQVLDDPHAWNSVVNVIVYAQNITQALQKYDPAHEMEYAKYGEYYVDQLRVLDAWIRQEVAKVPKEKRKVITAHDAFQYLGLEYDIRFLAPVGISTEEEPSARATAQLVDQIKSQNIRAVFVENISNTKLIEVIAKEAGVSIDGVLFSDALSRDDQPAPNYIALMRYNITQLVKAMLG